MPEGNTSVRIEIPQGAAKVLRVLEAAGFEGYVVGGCVRDSLLGKKPKDWDITTNALPAQVKALFPRTFDTGIAHGTVTVLAGGEGYEVTTFRIDGIYEDGRHPKSVTFAGHLEDDLSRRDLTINAMAYSERTGLVDLFGGRQDLERGLIRAVGDPMQRFSEDALRMLRTIRFAARFGASIEPETFEALKKLAPTLSKVSAERIRVELMGILLSDHASMLSAAREAGLLQVFLPELSECFGVAQNNPHHCRDVAEHILCSVEAVRPDPVLRLAMLLHDIGKPRTKTTDEAGCDHFHGHAKLSAEMAEKILRRLKFDNDTREAVVFLVRSHDCFLADTPAGVRRSLYEMGPERFRLLAEVKRADVAAQSGYLREEKYACLSRWEAMAEEEIRSGAPLSMKDLAVHGDDLAALGMSPGKEMGRVLKGMMEAVLEDPSLNTREALLARWKSEGAEI